MCGELGLDPDDLPPHDGQHFWYSAILAAQIDSSEAAVAADKLATKAKALGYVVAKATPK